LNDAVETEKREPGSRTPYKQRPASESGPYKQIQEGGIKPPLQRKTA
jgi:hypothetical protein